MNDVQTCTHDLTFAGKEVHKRFVAWDRGEADREWACLTVLAAHAPGLAPRPLRRETVDGAPVVVMERLPGTPLGRVPLTDHQTAALGRALRRVYAVPLAAVGAAGITERHGGPTAAPGMVAGWMAERHDLTPCREPELVGRAVVAARTWLEDGDALTTPRLSVLGIADLNPANLLWDGEAVRLVDFEDGGLTDPAYELADHAEHLAGRGVVDPDALADAVGLTPEERRRMTAYRRLWACFWLAMLLPGNGGFRRNPPGTTEAQAERVLGLLV